MRIVEKGGMTRFWRSRGSRCAALTKKPRGAGQRVAAAHAGQRRQTDVGTTWAPSVPYPTERQMLVFSLHGGNLARPPQGVTPLPDMYLGISIGAAVVLLSLLAWRMFFQPPTLE
jgi:hypothetical protein